MTASETKKIFRYGKLTLTADRQQVFPNDPGAGCPLLVEYDGGKYTASYNCAVNEGYLHSSRLGDKQLTQRQIDWLCSVEDKAESFLEGR